MDVEFWQNWPVKLLDPGWTFLITDSVSLGFPGGANGRVCLQCGRPRLDPWVGKIPWRRKWQPTPVSLPGKFHGLRSLAGYSPWGHKELDTTEQLNCLSFFQFHYWLLVCLGFLFLPDSVLEACIFLHIYPFLPILLQFVGV